MTISVPLYEDGWFDIFLRVVSVRVILWHLLLLNLLTLIVRVMQRTLDGTLFTVKPYRSCILNEIDYLYKILTHLT